MSTVLNIRPLFDAGTGTFTYLVDDGAGACAVIDPVLGFDARSGRRDTAAAEALARTIEAEQLRLEWLLETHAHADHLSAAAWLQQRLGGRIGIGEHIVQVQHTFSEIYHLDDLRPGGADFDHLFTDGEIFAIGGLKVEVLHVPGHTPADVAYRVFDVADVDDAVFVGDTLFMPQAGTARCDFPGGDAHQLFASARRLLALPPATRLFVCHDYPAADQPAVPVATVAQQRAANIHVRDGACEDEFVARRRSRDATLPMPQLLLPSVQVNVRAGHLPPPESNGTVYLRLPVDRF